MADRRAALLAALLAFSAALAADHVQWALQCGDPIARGDGPRHALVAVQHVLAQQERPLPLALRPLLATNYYPAFVAWLALPLLDALGPTAHRFRAFLGLYSGLLALGTGLLAWRCWGRSAALWAAALVGLVPVLWTLRAEVMLDAPLAAMAALFLVALPADGPARRGQALLAGLLLGAGMLTKQTLPYLALPALGVVGVRALVGAAPSWGGRALLAAALAAAGLVPVGLFLSGRGWPAVGAAALGGVAVAAWGHRHRGQPARRHLRDLALLGLVALAVAGPWYARSVEPLLAGLEMARLEHPDVPRGWPGLVRIVGMTEYLAHHLLPWPVLLAALAGAGCLPWVGRGRPWVAPTLAAGLGGFVLISRFPDLHGRHYVPLLPVLLALAAAPAALLWRAGRAGRGAVVLVTAAAVAATLTLATSWRTPLDLPAHHTIDRRDADIPPGIPAASLADLARRLSRPPTLLRLQAPAPTATLVRLREALARVEADRAAQTPQAKAHVLTGDVAIEVPGVHLALVELGATEVHPVSPATVAHAEAQLEREPVYLLELLTRGRAGRAHRRGPEPALARRGLLELGRWPAAHAESDLPLNLVLYRVER